MRNARSLADRPSFSVIIRARRGPALAFHRHGSDVSDKGAIPSGASEVKAQALASVVSAQREVVSQTAARA